MSISDKQLGNALILTPGNHNLTASMLRDVKFLILRGDGSYSLTLANIGSGVFKYLVIVNETTENIAIANTEVPARSSIIITFSGTVWF